jgi:Bacterial PH domain
MSALRTATAYEAAMWRGLYRWITRRPVELAPGDVAFGHAGPVKPIFAVFIVLSALEIPILDLIITRLVPWPVVRYVALAAGVYGLVWMIGLLGALLTNPHLVGDAGLRVRNGTSVDVTIPWDAVASVRHRYRSLPSSRAIQVEGAVLNLGTGGQTSVDITLREPLTLAIRKGPTEPVNEVRFYADDPKALVARARQHAGL